MTSNQIAYFKAKVEQEHYGRSDAEQARSNRAQEALTAMRNEYENAHYIRSDAENRRANIAKETENFRSNKAKESIEWAQIPSRNALNWSNVSRNYAEADLAKEKQEYTKADTENKRQDSLLKEAQTTTESYRPENIMQDSWLKYYQGQKTDTDRVLAPFYAFGTTLSGLGSFMGGASKIGGATNGKTDTQNKQLNETTRRWYEDGIQYQETTKW